MKKQRIKMKRQRIKKKNNIKFILFLIIIYLLAIGLCIHFGRKFNAGTKNDSTYSTDSPHNENISIVVMGDNLMHVPVFSSCKTGENKYDLHPLYEHLQPLISNADLAVIGQETLLAGKEYGYTGYPSFNSPQDVGETLIKEGFDLILCASNHAMDKGGDAVVSTMDFWEKHPEVTTIGFNRSSEEQNEVKVMNIKGVKIAVLNYTYDTNGIPLPTDRKYLINIIDEEKIRQDVQKAKEISDFIIVFPHWGTEYSITPDEFQKHYAQLMADLGVDIIIGSHPHVMEPTDIIKGKDGNETIVYYSLGNYVSSQQKAVNLLGGTALINLEADFSDDSVNVTVKTAELLITITHYNNQRSFFTVYPLKDYTDELAAKNGVSEMDGAVTVERLKTIVNNIFTEKNEIRLIY